MLVGGGEQAPCAGQQTRVVLHVGQVDFFLYGASGEPGVRTRC